MLYQKTGDCKAQKLCEKTSLLTDRNSDQGIDQTPTAQAKAAIQLDILATDQSPKLRIQPVLRHLEISPNRFFFGVELAGGSWALPLQLTASEVETLLKQARAIGGAK